MWTSPNGSRLWITGYAVPPGMNQWCQKTADRWFQKLCEDKGLEACADGQDWTDDRDCGGPMRSAVCKPKSSAKAGSRIATAASAPSQSTSSAKESHEWSAYRAGVFSHEVRSALTGAADVSGDGRVDYSELHAFVAAANSRVEDPRARIDLYVRPPAIDVRMPLVDLRQARFNNYLSVPAGAPAHFYLEDDRGVRYADVNLSGETATYLALVDRDFYWVRAPDEEREERRDRDRDPPSKPLRDITPPIVRASVFVRLNPVADSAPTTDASRMSEADILWTWTFRRRTTLSGES